MVNVIIKILLAFSSDLDGNKPQCFAQGGPALQELRKLILGKRWLESLHHYTKFRLVVTL